MVLFLSDADLNEKSCTKTRKKSGKSWIYTYIGIKSTICPSCVLWFENQKIFFKNTRNSRKFSGCFEIKIEILLPKLLLPILTVKFTTMGLLAGVYFLIPLSVFEYLESVISRDMQPENFREFRVFLKNFPISYGPWRYLVAHYATISSMGTELFST